MTTRKRRMTSAQILQEIPNNSDSDISDAESTYSESESVKSDNGSSGEMKVKLMMEELTTAMQVRLTYQLFSSYRQVNSSQSVCFYLLVGVLALLLAQLH